MDEYKQAASRLTDLIDTWLERSAAGKPPKRRAIKVRADEGTSAAERWGTGKSQQDEMEYLLWVVKDLKAKVLEAQAAALQQVRLQCRCRDKLPQAVTVSRRHGHARGVLV